MYKDSDELTRAIEELTLVKAGELLGCRVKVGVQRSPFREDKTPSFSVYNRDGRQWCKDHRTGEGGSVWAFVELARPAWQKRETARFILEATGRNPESARREEKPKRTPAEWAKEMRAEEMAQDLKRARDVLSTSPPTREPAWSQPVAERWAEGLGALTDQMREDLAAYRRWPVALVVELEALGLISFPRLPWVPDCEKNPARGIAWRVDRPPSQPGSSEPVTVGYHQRFERGWFYVPYRPKKSACTFQTQLQLAGQTVGPHPVRLGPDSARTWVILEGQWDAASFWWASGGPASPWAVFGIRGARSTGAFLADYREALTAAAPVVWLIPDNDEAGRAWVEPERAPGQPAGITFMEQLKASGAVECVASFLSGGHKDFDDLFSEVQPGREELTKWHDETIREKKKK